MAIIDNLVAYYSCDEASGNLIDAHGPHDLVENGTIAAGAAKVGSGSRDFEPSGGTDYATVANHADFNMASGEFSIAFWMKIESTGLQHVLSKQKTTAEYNGYAVYLAASGAVGVQTSDGTLVGFEGTGTSVNDLGWHHVVVTRSSTTGLIYVDGTLDHTGATRSGDLDDAIGLVVGAFSDGAGNPYDGLLDELCFWKGREVSSDDVTWLYNSGTGRSYADIVAEAGGGGGGILRHPGMSGGLNA